MEHIRLRDKNCSPHPPPTQADPPPLTPDGRLSEYPAPPSLPSSTTDFQRANTSRFSRLQPPRSGPLFRGFERPSFSRITILTVLCLLTYPAFLILTLVAKDTSLFIVRLVVSVWCSIVGFALGYVLLSIGARHLEAATWATVINMSHDGGGMKLRDLARGSRNPTSLIPAFHIFRSRFGNPETARRSREPHDKRRWSLYLGLFVVLAILGPLLPFLFGRIMEIETFISSQHKVYREVLIAGDLSEEDVRHADWWTSGLGTPDTAEFVYGNDTVYFAQPSPSQFAPGGFGAGAYKPSPPIGLGDTPKSAPVPRGKNASKSDSGGVLRYPQWGIRTHCEKLPDLGINLRTSPSKQYLTYLVVPQYFLRGLFGASGLDLPTELSKPPDYGPWYENDTIGLGIDSYFIPSKDTKGLEHHIISCTAGDDHGWVAVETVFVRLNTSFTPSGRFPVYSNESWLDKDGVETRIGYDAAVCVQRYEPWIVETHNKSTGSNILRIAGKGDGSTPLSPDGNIRGDRIANTRYLNTTKKGYAFDVSLNPSYSQVLDIFDRNLGDYVDAYTPSLSVVSMTEGTVSRGYTELSPERVGIILARIRAASTLPYLVGTKSVVAQLYEDEVLAFTTYKRWQLLSLPVLILILGIIGELFVPILPLNIPRREFGVYSWVALLRSQELQLEAGDELEKFMSLEELEEYLSDKRVKLIVEEVEV